MGAGRQYADHDEDAGEILVFRQWVKHFMAESIVGLVMDILNSVFSVISVALYIYESYLIDAEIISALEIVEVILAAYFTLDLTLNWFIADRCCYFWTSIMVWLDVITIVPGFATLGAMMERPTGMGTSGNSIADSAAFQFLRVLRVLRLLRLQRLMTYF